MHRKEVYEAIRRENEQAAKLRPDDVAEIVKKNKDKDKDKDGSTDDAAPSGGAEGSDPH